MPSYAEVHSRAINKPKATPKPTYGIFNTPKPKETKAHSSSAAMAKALAAAKAREAAQVRERARQQAVAKKPGISAARAANEHQSAVENAKANAAKAAAKKPAAKANSSNKSTTSKATSNQAANHAAAVAHNHQVVHDQQVAKAAEDAALKAAAEKQIADMRAKAKFNVGLSLDPQITEITRFLQDLGMKYDDSRDDTDRRNTIAQNDLGEIYNRLATYLGERNAQTAGNFATAGAQTDSTFANLQGQNTAQADAGRGNIQSELQRLSIGSGTGAPTTARFEEDANWLQGLAGANRAQAATTIGQNSATAQTLNNQLAANSQTSGSVERGRLNTENVDALNSLREGFNTSNTAGMLKKSDLEASRGGLEQQMFDQLESQTYERQQEQAQQDFMNQMAGNEFGLKADQFNADNQFRYDQLGLDAQTAASKNQNEIDRLQHDVNNATSLNQRAAAQMRLDQAELARKQNEPAKPVKNGGRAAGIGGASQYAVEAGKGNVGLTTAINGIIRHIDGNTTPFNPNHIGPIGGGYNQQDPKQYNQILKYAYTYLNNDYPAYNNATTKQMVADAVKIYLGIY